MSDESKSKLPEYLKPRPWHTRLPFGISVLFGNSIPVGQRRLLNAWYYPICEHSLGAIGVKVGPLMIRIDYGRKG